jgi:hypothetical protein
MILENYLQEISNKNLIQKKIIEFFKNNPKPSDDQIHEFAESENINKHKFEEIIYELLGSFFGQGRAKDFKGTYDPEQLKMGIEIEYEHTTNPLIAERIAKDHLSEPGLADYYTRLIKMEKEAKS